MGRKKTKQSVEINVVPYIDVMLVLLIIFMITAPQLEQGINVELSPTENNEVVEFPNKESALIVSIDADEKVYLSYIGEVETVDLKSLEKRASLFLSNNKNSKVFIRADKNLRYEIITKAIDILKTSGYESVGLITKPSS